MPAKITRAAVGKRNPKTAPMLIDKIEYACKVDIAHFCVNETTKNLVGLDMPTQIFDRNDLIVMLRYQFEIGIDEALLDFRTSRHRLQR